MDIVGGKVMSYAYYIDDFSAAREKAYQEGQAGIRDYDDVLHYINWETPRVSTISQKTDIGIYAVKEGEDAEGEANDEYVIIAEK